MTTPAHAFPLYKLGRFRYGSMFYYANDAFIGKSLENYGEWAQIELDFMLDFLSPGATVVDVGAYVGTHTLAFADAVSSAGKVYSFEPILSSWCALRANVEINDLSQVSVHQVGLGARNERLEFSSYYPSGTVENYGSMGSVACAEPGVRISATEDVQITRLDDMQLAACDLIKVDVEGMELDVLRGAVSVLNKFSPCVFTEITPDVNVPIDKSRAATELTKFMEEFGYDTYNAGSSLFNPNNFFGKKENIFRTYVSFAAFCCPKGWEISGLHPLVSGA